MSKLFTERDLYEQHIKKNPQQKNYIFTNNATVYVKGGSGGSGGNGGGGGSGSSLTLNYGLYVSSKNKNLFLNSLSNGGQAS